MRRAFVTGGTGFVGGHLVRALVTDGWRVTVAQRATSSREALRGLELDFVTADVMDADALERGMPEQPDVVFHLAANVGFSRRRNAEQTAVNVTGTRHVVQAALRRKAGRFVHVSSVAAWGPGEGDVIDESSPIRTSQHWINYARTKWLSELEVDQGIDSGLPAVIVNPTHIMGPGDHKNWGRLFAMARRARVVAAPDATAPWCHVADVVRSLIAAAERGDPGRRYLLGGPEVSYHEVLRLVRARVGRAPPARVAGWVLKAAAQLGRTAGFLRGREASLTPELASIWSTSFRIDDGRARRELAHAARPFEQTVDDTFRWVLTELRDAAP